MSPRRRMPATQPARTRHQPRATQSRLVFSLFSPLPCDACTSTRARLSPIRGIDAREIHPSFEGFACSAGTNRAEPGASAAGPGLLDRGTAALAGLAEASIRPELALHPAAGVGAVAEVGALAPDAEPERLEDALPQRADLVGCQPAGRPQRVQPRMPQRLVRVDVPEPGDRALVEDRRFQRRLPAREPPRQERRREAAAERLRAEPARKVLLGLIAVEQQPGAEAAQVAVGDSGAVVELEDGTLVRGRLVAEPAGHT